ncbi:enhanced intracellular survival protein Eis [Peptococcus simiae]|uniref:GNAT family N-acetyltransferase n=1 Tax=Peptococcus simiae TaxID=1643805 RepID=UPI00397F8401
MINWGIRPAEARDGELLKELWRYSFHRDGEVFTDWYFKEYHRFSETLVATSPVGQVVASLQCIDMTLKKKAQSLKTAYIVGVNAFPEVRGRGAVGALMQEALKRSPYTGLLLMPFEGNFYAPLGFRYMNYHGQISVPMGELYAYSQKTDLTFKRFSLKAAPVTDLDRVYSTWQGRYYAFYVQRDSRRWQALLDDLAAEGGYGVMAYAQGQLVGYLLYSLQEKTFYIREMAYLLDRARAGLYHYVTGHRSQLGTVTWSAPLDEPVIDQPAGAKDYITYEPFMMWRFLSPASLPFFASKGPTTPLIFAYRDSHLNRTSLWRWQDDRIEAIDQAEAAFSVTPETLSEVVFGHRRRLDQDCEIKDAEDFVAFCALFPSRPLAYINEYF